MNYIYSEDGLDIKVINPKTGKTKFLTKHIAENAKRMKSLGLQIFEAPLTIEPIFVQETVVFTEATTDPEQLDLTQVAETTVAKKGSKQTK